MSVRIFSLFFLLAGFKALAQNSPGSKIYWPVMFCEGSQQGQSLAIYEAEVIRGQQFDRGLFATREGLQAEQMQRSFLILQNYSAARARYYQRVGSSVFSLVKAVSTRLATDPSFNEIVVPLNCHLETLAVIDLDTDLKPKQIYLSLPLWNQLEGAGQISFWLELFSVQELLQNKVGFASSSLGARLFSGYVLAKNSPLQDRLTRFQVLTRIGFSYAEYEPLGLCVDLSRPITWQADQPTAGFAYGDAFFPECRLIYRQQSMNARGEYHLFDNNSFASLSIDIALAHEPAGYRDDILSKNYGVDLFFRSSGFNEHPVVFFPNGQVQKGNLVADNHPVLKSEFYELSVGRQKFGSFDNWSESDIEFWPNGQPKTIERAYGQVLIQGKFYSFSGDEVSFHSSGRVDCAEFLPGTTFKTRTKQIFRVVEDHRKVCFDEESFPTSP